MISREIGDKRGEGTDLSNLGAAYFQLGETRKAIDLCEQALTISREIEDKRGEVSDLCNLGISYSHLGETLKAIDLCEQALTISREIGDKSGEGTNLGNLGIAYSDQARCSKPSSSMIKHYQSFKKSEIEVTRQNVSAI